MVSFFQITDLLALIAEHFIFNYLGISMFVFLKHRFDPILIIGSLLGIAVGRAFTVYPVAFLLNLCRRDKIPCDVNLQNVFFLAIILFVPVHL